MSNLIVLDVQEHVVDHYFSFYGLYLKYSHKSVCIHVGIMADDCRVSLWYKMFWVKRPEATPCLWTVVTSKPLHCDSV